MARQVAPALDGFQHYKTCTCGGSLQDRYWRIGNTSNKYYIFPNRGQVRLFKDGRGVGMFSLSKLQEKITEYGI